MKTIIGLFIILFILVLVTTSFINGKGISLTPKTSTVTIDTHTFAVEVEQTEAAREKGLSGRSSLLTTQGMLFLFDKSGQYPFWMKDMKFPIDIIYINGTHVVDVFSNVPFPQPNTPDASLPVYVSTNPADKVLEVDAGTAEKDGIKNGDTITISL